MFELNIKISMDQNNCIYPDPNGLGNCLVTFGMNPMGEKTATIAFAGMNQSFITFDESGTRVVSHTCYSVNPSNETLIGINNIIHYLNTNPVNGAVAVM